MNICKPSVGVAETPGGMAVELVAEPVVHAKGAVEGHAGCGRGRRSAVQRVLAVPWCRAVIPRTA